MNKQEKLVAALKLWEKISGFDKKREGFTFGQMRVSEMSDAIREALELDDTNITGFLMLGYIANRFIGDTNFSLNDLLNKPEEVAGFVDNTRQLLALLEDKEMLDDVAHFQLVTRQAVRHYLADTEEVMKLIEDRQEIGLLRRDALHSMKNLRVDYFTHGSPEPEGVKPKYHREVFQFWNINSMLRALCNSPSGVSLNLIRTPDNFQSYFVFAIRNGGHIITLSDLPAYPHPLAKYMSRRPDKEFGKRIMQNWFPYDLMNWKYDEESGRLWIEKQDLGNGVTPINQTAFPLSPLNELGAGEVVWITLMFELIVERFWRRPVAADQLSYTGEMVKARDVLIDHAASVNLPVVQYQGIEVTDLTVEEVASPSDDMKAALGKSGGNHNEWLIDRYKHKVNPLMLNMLNTGNVTAYLTKEEGEGAVPAVISTEKFEREVNTVFKNHIEKYKYHSLDSAAFGSKQELLNDRLFMARANLATEIQRLADTEYDERKEQISAWYKERVEANMDNLLALACEEECWVEKVGADAPERVRGTYRPGNGAMRYRLAKVYDYEGYKKELGHIGHDHSFHQGYNRSSSRAYCYLNGTQSSWMLSIDPQTAAELAFVTGMTVEELPDVLQRWVSEQDHKGNHLLSRIDPVAWMLSDPWIYGGRFSISIWLSTRALNAVRKSSKFPEGLNLFKNSKDNWKYERPTNDLGM